MKPTRTTTPSGDEFPPPPAPPPMAPVADPKLVMFMYILARDLLPVGHLDHALARALRERPDLMTNPDLRTLADRIARTLTFTSGMLPASISDARQESQPHVPE